MLPGVGILLLLMTCESENVLYSWGCVRQVPLSNCCPLVHMYCFPVGDLLPIGIVIPVEGGKRWVSSCAGWRQFSSSIVFCFIVYILSCCVCLGCTLYIVQDFLSWCGGLICVRFTSHDCVRGTLRLLGSLISKWIV